MGRPPIWLNLAVAILCAIAALDQMWRGELWSITLLLIGLVIWNIITAIGTWRTKHE